MPMLNPPHPGRMLLRDCIEALGLTVAEAAEHLRVNEEALAAICRREAPITADIAVRVDKAFGGSAEAWLRMQVAHDLAQARRDVEQVSIKRIERAA